MIHIALLGVGTIGGGVVKLLEQNYNGIKRKSGTDIKLKYVLARTPEKAKQLGVDDSQIVQDFSVILNDPEVDIVVELMGGMGDAYTYIRQSLEHGKNVVTANKDLISFKGKELFELAADNKVDLYYEASVGGTIPIINPMRRTLAANRVDKMLGILNGTTNYMLTKMTVDGRSYEDVLDECQRLGFAEADPSADVDGLDPARKIAILAKIAFNVDVTADDVYNEGIREIKQHDIAIAEKMGYALKLLAVAKDKNKQVQLGVYPVFVPKKHPLASVNDSFNALFVHGDACGDVMLYGQGAGAMPTASSVMGDIMQIARHIKAGSTGEDNDITYLDKKILTIDEVENMFYIRLLVKDQTNVLSGVAKAFGDNDVSISSVVQNSSDEGEAELVIITHSAAERGVRAALERIQEKDYVQSIEAVIRVLES
ncbi:MAG: homoserine dehydrogenase [Fastidiosipilaceae bacterium]